MALLVAVACTTDGGRDLTGRNPQGMAPSARASASTSASAPPDDAAGSITDYSPAASGNPWATATPHQGGGASPTPTPTPSPTPTSPVASISVQPAYRTFYLPTTEQVQLSGAVTLAKGGPGDFEWVNMATGSLTVDASGVVAVEPATLTGAYEVQVRAIDDPAVTASAWFTVIAPQAYVNFTIE